MNRQPPAPAPGAIVSTRFFAAPRELVFRAFSDPTLLAGWWGPKGFTNTFHEFDFRPGGAWRFVMHGPDGTGYPMAKDFVEIVHPERISFRHVQAGHEFLMTISLREEGRGTHLTWSMQFDSEAEAERVRQVILESNEENFDRLDDQLASMRAGPSPGL